MGFEQVQAIARIGGRRGANWKDERRRSPKALGDMSGVILSRVTSRTSAAIQQFDYDTLSQIYVCNDLAWTCINLVSSTAAQGKLKVRKREGKDLKYLPDHPLQKVLDFPNSSMTQFDLIQSYVTHQMLFGTVGFILLRKEMLNPCPYTDSEGNLCGGLDALSCEHKLLLASPNSPVVQIMPVHPSNIEELIYTTPDGIRKKYLCYVPDGMGGRKYPISQDNFLADPYYNTDVSWYGVSPTFLLKRWLDLDTAMTDQLTKFFENGAIPSLLVSLKPNTNYTYEQEPETIIDMMKQKWDERFGKGGTTEKAPAFLHGDIKIDQLQEKIEEMVAKNLYFEIENRICATYGVPPNLYEIGLKYGSQRASTQQAEKDFYNRTISKILNRIEKKINQLVVSSYNEPGLEVVWDLSDVNVAAFILEQKKLEIERHWQQGLIKRDTTLMLLGYEPIGGELGDDLYRLTVTDGSSGLDGKGKAQDNKLKVPDTNNGNVASPSKVSTTLDK